MFCFPNLVINFASFPSCFSSLVPSKLRINKEKSRSLATLIHSVGVAGSYLFPILQS
jgi:hypothetical protein